MMYNCRSISTKINAKIGFSVDLRKVGPERESDASISEAMFELAKAITCKTIIG